jgi:hypothetical protein
MAFSRREALAGSAALVVAAWGRARFTFAAESPAVAALDKSNLIYLTPILSGGAESSCHSEVWFVHHEAEIFVITRADAWRAEALRRGLRRAKIWIGEFGVWKRAKDRYRSAPYLEIEGALETDTGVHAELLEKFGRKYESEWGSWGPPFREGLADGTRVLLRYRIAA